MTTIQIELPDATVQAAREAGLLTAQALERLITDALKRQQAGDALLNIADRVAAAGVEPMSMDEINAEVKAARAERASVQAIHTRPKAGCLMQRLGTLAHCPSVEKHAPHYRKGDDYYRPIEALLPFRQRLILLLRHRARGSNHLLTSSLFIRL
jgi:hypothetical protein